MRVRFSSLGSLLLPALALVALACTAACTDRGEVPTSTPSPTGGSTAESSSSSGSAESTSSGTTSSGMGGMGGNAGMGGMGGEAGMGGNAGMGGMGGEAGMGGMGGAGGANSHGSVIFGLQDMEQVSEPVSLTITKRINGAIVETLVYGTPNLPFPTSPLEIPFSDLPDGTMVTVEATTNVSWGASAQHRASTTVVAGKTLLVRQHIDSSCHVSPGYDYCPNGKSCTQWACVESFLPPSTLEQYAPDWMNYSSCNIPGAGAPVVILGEGYDQFRTLLDGDTITLGEGGQGGYHFWLALRTQNLGRLVTVKALGKLPALAAETFLNTWDMNQIEPTGSGYCETWGQQLQVDYLVPNAPDDLIGKELVVEVTVQSEQGATASTTRTVKIGPMP